MRSKKKFSNRLYHTSEVVLKLDDYGDIFSDFDARPYHQKALSQDFLSETKRASIDKQFDVIELKLLVPGHKRILKHEETIKKRLKAHFKRHFNMLKEEKMKIIKNGVIYTFIGIIIMIAATLLMMTADERNFVVAFLTVFLEPAGWFLFWEGLDLVIFESKRKNIDFEFYEKMSGSRIYFLRY